MKQKINIKKAWLTNLFIYRLSCHNSHGVGFVSFGKKIGADTSFRSFERVSLALPNLV